jgi:hypothetical protein
MHPKTQTSPVSWRANTVGRNSMVSWGDPWYTAYLVGFTSTWWERRQPKDWACLAPSLPREVALSIRNGELLYKQLIHPMMDYACLIWSPLLAPTSGSCKCCNPSVFALRLTHLGTLVTGKFTRIWGFHSSLTTSEY